MHLHTITMCRKGLANMLCPQKQLNGCKIGRLFLLGFLLDIWILNAAKIHQKQETTKESASINKRLTLQCVGIPEKVVSLQQTFVRLERAPTSSLSEGSMRSCPSSQMLLWQLDIGRDWADWEVPTALKKGCSQVCTTKCRIYLHSGKRVLTLLLTSAFLPLVWERAVSLPN